MASAFQVVKRGSGITAVAATTCYTVAASMAFGDGDGVGVEIPPPVSTLAIMLIVCSTIIGGGAWLIEHAHRIAAERQIRPVVRDVVDQAFAEAMPLMVATLAEALDHRIVPQMHDVAVAAGKQSAVRFRDMVTQDLREILNDAHRRAIVTGQRLQATASGEAIGRAALRSIPNGYASTSRED